MSIYLLQGEKLDWNIRKSREIMSPPLTPTQLLSVVKFVIEEKEKE